MLEVPGSPGGVVRGARNRGGRGRGGRGARGGNGGEKGGEKKDGQPNINASDGNVDGKKGGDARCSRCGEAATKRCDAPDRSVAFAGERAIRRKYAPTSSPSLPAKLTRVAATATGFLAEKSRTPSSVMHQASFSTSLVNGVQMRSLGRWGISR